MARKKQSSKTAASWPDDVYRVFVDADVRQVAYVPDAGHARLISRCEQCRRMRAVPLTTEEEGVALLAGAWLGGERGALLMQSSGVGNCINMLAMIQECRFPLFTLVTMRGDWGEFNPWQVPMGKGTARTLDNAGVIIKAVDDADRVAETVTASLRLAFGTYRAVAVLISQRVIGYKEWK
ncbi:MAG: thiamine pyrophosphate-binding protein [Gammaproteobacteria bacterium]|nr:thiamine pyrophosphate-binding protein [Gammaproteobacteria bacterium]